QHQDQVNAGRGIGSCRGITFQVVKPVGERVGGPGSKRQKGLTRKSGVVGAARDLAGYERECESERHEQTADLNNVVMGTSFHNATGAGQNLAFGLPPIDPTNHSSTYSICHASWESFFMLAMS